MFVAIWMSLLFLIATNIQAGWLYVIISFLAMVSIYSLIIPEIALRSISARVELPELCERGSESIATIYIENSSRRPRYLTRAEFPETDEIKFNPGAALAIKIEGHGRLALGIKFTPLRRGKLELKHFYISNGAPLGLAMRYRRVKSTATTLAHPRISPSEGERIMSEAGKEGFGAREKFFAIEDPYHYKLREYAPGDDMARIHWKLTARRDRPIVRVHERKIFGHSGIKVDNIRENYPGGEDVFEAVLEQAISLAWHILYVRGSSVSVSGTAAPEITAETPDFWNSILAWFAKIRLESAPPQDEAGEHFERKDFEFTAADAEVSKSN